MIIAINLGNRFPILLTIRSVVQFQALFFIPILSASPTPLLSS